MCLKMVVVVTVSENYIFENETPPFSTAIVARMNFTVRGCDASKTLWICFEWNGKINHGDG